MSEVEPVTVGKRGSAGFMGAVSEDDGPPAHRHKRSHGPILRAEARPDEPPLPPHCVGREHLMIETRRGVRCLWCGREAR